MGFEDLIVIIILGGIGLIIVVLGIYLKLIDIKFRKNGVVLEFKVKKTKKETQEDKDGTKIGELYITTFEFNYNDKLIEETIETKSEFEVGKSYKGIYLPTSKLNKISVAGEGFNLSRGGATFIIVSGIYILFITLAIIFKLSLEIIITVTIIVFLFLKLLPKLLKK